MSSETDTSADAVSPESDARVQAEARRWIERREAGLGPAEQRALQAWLANPRNAAVFARADRHGSELDWPVHTGSSDRILAGLRQRAHRRQRRRRSLQASTAALLVVLGLFWIFRSEHVSSPRPGVLIVQAPRQQTLPDGSTVELNDDAEIDIRYGPHERRVVLRRGSAHFKVEKDQGRPFLVSTETFTARAVGTAFMVSLEAQRVALLVTEGRVAIDRPLAPPATPAPDKPPSVVATPEVLALVSAGESVAVIPNTDQPTLPNVHPLPPEEWQEHMAWRSPRLEFNGTPLDEVVAIVNQHNREQLIIADPSLKALQLSGALRADRIEALLAMLAADFNVASSRDEGRILLQRAR